jgi:hypothetical protein
MNPKTSSCKRSSWVAVLVLTCTCVLVAPASKAGFKIGDDETYLKIGLLLQGWAVFTEEGAPDHKSWDTDFYLRRLRFMLYGQLTDKIHFFVETDTPDFGKQGDFSSRTFIQDAWLEYNVHKMLQIDAGMLLVPFSHHGMQGAVSLHSLDYHGKLIRYPSGGHKVWRDYGVMVRGMVPCELIEYRLAILNGVHGSAEDPRNPRDWPRVTARVTLNLFESEGGPGTAGFFYDGLYLKESEGEVISPKKILSFGFSADWQKDLNVTLRQQTGVVDDRDDYFALAVDAFFDLPLDDLGSMAVAGQAGFYYYEHGDRRTYSDSSPRTHYGTGDFSSEFTGYGLMSEVGFRFHAYEVLLSVDWFEAIESDGHEGDYLAVYGGFNWWWKGHTASLKLQAGSSKTGSIGLEGDWGFAGQVQAQLLF